MTDKILKNEHNLPDYVLMQLYVLSDLYDLSAQQLNILYNALAIAYISGCNHGMGMAKALHELPAEIRSTLSPEDLAKGLGMPE